MPRQSLHACKAATIGKRRDMAKANDHGGLIAAAARSTLRPLGCKQKGRSRLWFADQRYWLIVVEFQPSGWSKGSYLNVAATWPWYAKGHWSFDFFHPSHPHKKFFPFVDEQQFAPIAKELAATAAGQINRLRQDFASLEAIADCLVANVGRTDLDVYHAAVASGLVGDTETSRRLFHQLEQQPAAHDWQKELRVTGTSLAECLGDRQTYRARVLAQIEQCRSLLGLPADPTCLDGT
jgi:hypothetical protein